MKTIVFDLDGTLYRGASLIPAGLYAVRQCQENGIPFLFLTNNSMRTRKENLEHMEAMGYTGLQENQFYNSAMCAAAYASGLNQGKKAFYIGMEGMRKALEDEGFTITDDHPDFVFIGLDKSADYHDYSKALGLLLKGAKLIGTNKDRILAKPEGFEMGNGSIVKMFEYASGQDSPDLAKPSMPILDFLLEKEGLSKKDIVLVGDNLETDIALGYNNGVQTILTESGVHDRRDIGRLGIYPDLITDSLENVDWVRIAQTD